MDSRPVKPVKQAPVLFPAWRDLFELPEFQLRQDEFKAYQDLLQNTQPHTIRVGESACEVVLLDPTPLKSKHKDSTLKKRISELNRLLDGVVLLAMERKKWVAALLELSAAAHGWEASLREAVHAHFTQRAAEAGFEKLFRVVVWNVQGESVTKKGAREEESPPGGPRGVAAAGPPAGFKVFVCRPHDVDADPARRFREELERTPEIGTVTSLAEGLNAANAVDLIGQADAVVVYVGDNLTDCPQLVQELLCAVVRKRLVFAFYSTAEPLRPPFLADYHYLQTIHSAEPPTAATFAETVVRAIRADREQWREWYEAQELIDLVARRDAHGEPFQTEVLARIIEDLKDKVAGILRNCYSFNIGLLHGSLALASALFRQAREVYAVSDDRVSTFWVGNDPETEKKIQEYIQSQPGAEGVPGRTVRLFVFSDPGRLEEYGPVLDQHHRAYGESEDSAVLVCSAAEYEHLRAHLRQAAGAGLDGGTEGFRDFAILKYSEDRYFKASVDRNTLRFERLERQDVLGSSFRAFMDLMKDLAGSPYGPRSRGLGNGAKLRFGRWMEEAHRSDEVCAMLLKGVFAKRRGCILHMAFIAGGAQKLDDYRQVKKLRDIIVNVRKQLLHHLSHLKAYGLVDVWFGEKAEPPAGLGAEADLHIEDPRDNRFVLVLRFDGEHRDLAGFYRDPVVTGIRDEFHKRMDEEFGAWGEGSKPLDRIEKALLRVDERGDLGNALRLVRKALYSRYVLRRDYEDTLSYEEEHTLQGATPSEAAAKEGRAGPEPRTGPHRAPSDSLLPQVEP